MAISTYKVFLMYKTTQSGTYRKLIDIKDFPDLGGDPEQLETTTLSDNMNTYIPGIQSLDGLEFTANYTKDDYNRLYNMQEDENGTKIEYYFAVVFGGSMVGSTLTPNGIDGVFEFQGRLSVYPTGGGVNEVVDLKISISPSTPIKFSSNTISVTDKKITYDKNNEGASGSIPDTIASPGSVVSISTGRGLTAPSGKRFIGWNTNSSAETATYVGGESYTMTNADLNLFAIWQDIV